VHTAVSTLKRWTAAVAAGDRDQPEALARLAADLSQAHRVYSRGFSDGFFFGSDHQTLVDGRFPKHRGARLGTVVAVRGDEVVVERVIEPGAGPVEAPPEPVRGMGVGFDAGNPEAREAGGPIFDVEPTPGGWVLGFLKQERGGPDLSRVTPGQRVWATGDAHAEQRALRLLKQPEPEGRIGLVMRIAGALGEPLRVTLLTALGEASGATDVRLVRATGPGLGEALLAEKLGAFGGTPFRLERLDRAELSPGLFVPPGALKALRRVLLGELEALLEGWGARAVRADPVCDAIRERLVAATRPASRPATAPTLLPLCRSEAQLEAAIAAGAGEVELDFMELVGLGRAVERARKAGVRVTLATTRVQKPGEEGIDRRLRKLRPDGLLVRHWGGLVAFAEGFRLEPDEHLPVVHGDFSLNVTNSLTGLHLLGLGLDSVTASHDLDEHQLMGLVAAMPAERVTVVVHHHIPTFHTEHCVYAHTLSQGRDYRTCGRPCERHELALVDPIGLRHPVVTDVGCRNTVFEARAQSAAALVPRLHAAGVRRFRVELVRESAAETALVLAAYRRLLAGETSPRAVVAEVGGHEQFGVVRGIAASARAAK
jgi:putative protease